ncbi:MAG TPA: hypothetical protein VNR61_17200 [Niallia sp.]|nr:hypothetical protein [Niallia sp.]
MPKQNHPNKSSKIYFPTNPTTISNNQTHYQQNYLKAYLIDQQKKNEELTNIITDFHEHTIQSQDSQLAQIHTINDKLQVNDSITKDLLQHLSNLNEQTNNIYEQIHVLENASNEQKKLILEEAIRHTALFDQILYQDRDISILTDKMKEFNEIAVEMREKLNHIDSAYETVEEKLTLQEIFHETILENLEETNGNVNKLRRQMDYLKEIIFERANYLTKKLEEYINSLKLPVQRFFVKLDKEEQEKPKKP